MGGWQAALWLSPVSLYGAVAFAFNRLEVRITPTAIQWLDRPLPVRRSRQIQRDQITTWLHGPSPNRADPNGPESEAKIFTAGVELKDQSIVRFADRLPDREQTKEIADRCATYCHQPSVHHPSMRGTHEVPGHSWIDVAEWVFKIGTVLIFCWQLFIQSQN